MAAQDDRSEHIQDLEDAIDSAAEAELTREAVAPGAANLGPREFNARIIAPLYYNSNAQLTQSGGSGALEGDPQIELGWARGLTSAPLKLTATLRADMDRYANVPQADEDETSGFSKVQYYDSGDDQAWAPFLSYRAVLLFDPTFAQWTMTRNDLNLGLEKLFNFDGSLHLLPISARSRGDAVWTVGLSVSVQRRFRTPGPDSTALYVAPSVSYVPAERWALSVALMTRQCWFDGSTSGTIATSRRDFDLHPILTIAYQPPDALFGSDGSTQKRALRAPLLAFQLGCERRWSNLPARSWSQWTVGPVLSWSF